MSTYGPWYSWWDISNPFSLYWLIGIPLQDELWMCIENKTSNILNLLLLEAAFVIFTTDTWRVYKAFIFISLVGNIVILYFRSMFPPSNFKQHLEFILVYTLMISITILSFLIKTNSRNTNVLRSLMFNILQASELTKKVIWWFSWSKVLVWLEWMEALWIYYVILSIRAEASSGQLGWLHKVSGHQTCPMHHH